MTNTALLPVDKLRQIASSADPLTFRQVHRLGDGFFLKLSYLYKV